MFTKNLNKDKFPERKRDRHKDFDYSQNGVYFITICTKDKQKCLSEIYYDKRIMSNVVKLKPIGAIVKESLEYIESSFSDCLINDYVIMPNHVHLLVSIERNNNIDIREIIQRFKSFTTHKNKKPLWQRSYYDHIIRNEKDFLEKQKYIQDNPSKWMTDEYY